MILTCDSVVLEIEANQNLYFFSLKHSVWNVLESTAGKLRGSANVLERLRSILEPKAKVIFESINSNLASLKFKISPWDYLRTYLPRYIKL